MTEAIVKTADGRITFLAKEFRSMQVLPKRAFIPQNEVIIWTDTWSSGLIFPYPTLEDAKAVAREIQAQL